MFRKALSASGLLLLAGALVLATPGPSQARGGGGHGGGGFPGGGGFHGGAHFGGYRGGYYGHSYAHYGYGRFYGGYGYGLGYPYYGYGYGVYPFYGTAAYDPYAYDGRAVTDDTGYNGSYPDATPPYPYGSLAPSSTDNTVRVTVNVPANAKVWFGDALTTSTGTVREFQSPPLAPGHNFAYKVRATWSENGKEVTQTQEVAVTAGSHVSAKFPEPIR
jgi:uncharacterized protein (TIGR03000 family)